MDFRKFVDTHIMPNRVYDKPFPIDEEGDPGFKWPKQEKKRDKKSALNLKSL